MSEPSPLPVRAQCPTCTAASEEQIAELEWKLHAALESCYALAEQADDAETLCNWLAWHLADIKPDFFETLLDDETRDLWHVVKPFGPAEEAEDG